MRAYVDTHIQARGIGRVVAALRAHAHESGVTVVDRKEDADLVVHHVVGEQNFDDVPIWQRVAQDHENGRRAAMVQYCVRSAGSQPFWSELWGMSAVVWSYLPIPEQPWPVRRYRAPLGIAPPFLQDQPARRRDVGVVTTGYVAGPGAEAIEEVAQAAARAGLAVIHVGPYPERMRKPPPGRFGCLFGITDADLAGLYRRARFVSGLRHVEGFELPAVEGLSCGARPIMFDREDARTWHGDAARYVPEGDGAPLVEALEALLRAPYEPVCREDVEDARIRFDWARIVRGFWSRAHQGMEEESWARKVQA